MLLVLRRIRIVAEAVAVLNLSVFAVDHKLGLFPLCLRAALIHGFGLGRIYATGALRAGGASTPSQNQELERGLSPAEVVARFQGMTADGYLAALQNDAFATGLADITYGKKYLALELQGLAYGSNKAIFIGDCDR